MKAHKSCASPLGRGGICLANDGEGIVLSALYSLLRHLHCPHSFDFNSLSHNDIPERSLI